MRFYHFYPATRMGVQLPSVISLTTFGGAGSCPTGAPFKGAGSAGAEPSRQLDSAAAEHFEQPGSSGGSGSHPTAVRHEPNPPSIECREDKVEAISFVH